MNWFEKLDLPYLVLYFGFITLRPHRKVLQELMSLRMKDEVFLLRVEHSSVEIITSVVPKEGRCSKFLGDLYRVK